MTAAPTRDTGSTTPPLLPLAAAGVTLLFWSSAFVAIRHLGHDVGAGELSLGRLGVAAVTLGAVLLVRAARGRRLTWPGTRDLPLLLLCGIAWFGVYNIALNASEQRIDAGTAALVIQVGPLITALLAAVLLSEPLHRWLVVGMAVGFAGVALIAQGSASSASLDALGVGLALIAAVTYAIGVLAQKPLVARIAPFEITFLACVIGTVVCLPWAPGLVDVVRDAPASSVWWIVYLGVFPTALAFSTWAYALTHTDAGKMALTTFLVPLLATLLAWALLSEVPPALSFVGGGLTIVGVLLTRMPRRRPGSPPAGGRPGPPPAETAPAPGSARTPSSSGSG